MNADQSDGDQALYRLRHSLAHVMAQAVLDMRPGTTLGFGPPINDGFYYDFILSQPITEADFPELEQRMRRILKKGQRFYREDLAVDDAFARLDEMQEPADRGVERRLQLRGDVGNVLDGLTSRQRALLWLAYVEGMQHREIAEVLGLSRLSIRPLLFRARRRMARELRARGIGPVGVAGRSS